MTGATYVPNAPNIPPGFAYFLVDFQIQNNGGAPIDLRRLQLVLVDEIGNQYALNPVASQSGTNPPMTGGFLNPSQLMLATVGYQIPAGLTSSTLTWTVVRSDTGEQVQVSIPYTGPGAENTVITLQSVEVSADLSSLLLVGQITNSGTQAVVIAQPDVTLRTPDGASYLMLSANPPFPWTVPPGQTLLYGATFQRPTTSDSAIFTLLNQPFQLTNLNS
jgi:hypothetical protein